MRITFQALLQNVLDHVTELRLFGDELHLRELDVVADLDHVVAEKLPALGDRPVHQVLAVVVEAVEDEKTGRCILEA